MYMHVALCGIHRSRTPLIQSPHGHPYERAPVATPNILPCGPAGSRALMAPLLLGPDGAPKASEARSEPLQRRASVSKCGS